MPPFDRSAMDGFALAGGYGEYRIAGEVAAGDGTGISLEPGTAAVIRTGAPGPGGADRVLPVEKAFVDGAVLRPAAIPVRGADICRRGEDLEAGAAAIRAGSVLDPQAVGLAAMAGATDPLVYARPRTAILTTGSEIVEPGTLPGPAQVRNANRVLLEALCRMTGFEVAACGHSADDPARTVEAASRLLESADALLVAGGISMGAHDHVAPALERAGVSFLLREVAIKPGKPFSFGLREGRPVFCLPGNPVSVYCTFEELVLPALRRMAGNPRHRKAVLTGRALFRHVQRPGRTGLLRVRAVMENGAWLLSMPPSNGSGDLASTLGTDALARCGAALDRIEEGDGVPFTLAGWAHGAEAWA